MNGWIERKAKRMVLAGVLAFAVGAPTLACMGGAEDGSGGGESDLKSKLKGTWQVKPHPDEIRPLKVIAIAIRPNGNEEMLKKQLQPPPNAEELKLFQEVKRRGKNDPEVKFYAQMIELMKGATLVIDDSNWTYTIGSDKAVMPYTVHESSGSTMKITLSNTPAGTEDWTLNFSGDSKIDLQNTRPSDQRLVFQRK